MSSTGQKGYGKEIMKYLQVFTTTPQQPQNQERISKRGELILHVRARYNKTLSTVITLANKASKEVNKPPGKVFIVGPVQIVLGDLCSGHGKRKD